MNRLLQISSIIAVAVMLTAGIASAVTIDWTTVGDPGNVGDTQVMTYDGTTGYGVVPYAYSIDKYEVTAGQYAEFLNAVGGVDTYTLYNTNMATAKTGCGITRTGGGTIGNPYAYSVAADYVNRPVNFVSWGDSARFCNWLHNGQLSGAQDSSTTETGAYLLNGANTDTALMAVAVHDVGAKYWIPTENEWYKAAYYKAGSTDAGYWLYPTQSNSDPGRDMTEATNTGNNANRYATPYPIGSNIYTTVAGEFESSVSAYGTFDQCGNVWEWNETAYNSSNRGLRGGCFGDSLTSGNLKSSSRFYSTPAFEKFTFGFRVASAPPAPPSSISWIGGSEGSETAWGVEGNWDAAPVPDYAGAKVVFGNQSSANGIVDLDLTGRTVGCITFAATTSTTILSTYGFALTLDNNGSDSTIEVEGSHTISAPVIINNDVIISGSGTLNLSGGITGDHALTVLGNLTATSIQVDSLAIGTNAAMQAVPEPSSLLLLCSGALGLLAFASRRRNA
jgi:formylglycine-generating enzyme